MGMLLESGQQRATRTGRNSLPANILALMDLEILEICKDSFIEPCLSMAWRFAWPQEVVT